MVLTSIHLSAQETNSSPQKCDNYPKQKIEASRVNIMLNPQQEQQIITNFRNICQNDSNQSKKVMYRTSVSKMTQNKDTIYLLFKDDIDSYIDKTSKRSCDEYIIKYNLTEEQAESISELIKLKAKETGLSFFIYPEDNKKRISSNMANNSKYNKDIMVTLTLIGAKTYLAKYYSPILKYKKALKLSDDQLTKFIDTGYDHIAKEMSDPEFKILTETHKLIKEVFTPEQYDKYLTYTNIKKAQKAAENRWTEAVELGIDIEMDSVMVKKQLTAYYLEDYKIKERYKLISEKDGEKTEELEALKQKQPKALKKINITKKRAKATRTKDRNTMVW